MTNNQTPDSGDFAWRAFSPCELSARAHEQAENAPAPLRRSVYLYYLSRYLFSLYEAAFASMPRQILNEYRNGLDHFMRFLSGGGAFEKDDSHRNLHKVQGHLQRAVLDVCKYHAISTAQWVAEFESKHSTGVLDLVSDGKFWRELQHGKKEAERAFEEAKFSDTALGEHSAGNDGVIDAYLKTAHLWRGVRTLCVDNADNIARARKEYGGISKRAENISVKKQIAIAFGTGAALSAFILWLGKVAG